jgi:hypothetical protein
MTSILPLRAKKKLRIWKRFSSPELKAQVSFFDRQLFVVCLLDFYIYIFDFSKTAGPILAKVGTNHP